MVILLVIRAMMGMMVVVVVMVDVVVMVVVGIMINTDSYVFFFYVSMCDDKGAFEYYNITIEFVIFLHSSSTHTAL